MKEVAAAHSCLSDPSRRAEYDRRLAGGAEEEEEEEFVFDLYTFFAFMFEMRQERGHGFHC